MSEQSSLSSQAHLALGSMALDRLRQQFLLFLELKEQEVRERMTTGTGQGGQVVAERAEGLSEWL